MVLIYKIIFLTLFSLLIKYQSCERHVLISSGNFILITTLFSNVFNFSTESVRCRFLVRLLSSTKQNSHLKKTFFEDKLLKVALVDDESRLSSAVLN